MTTLMDAPTFETVSLGDQLRAWAETTKSIHSLLADVVPSSAIGVAESMAEELDAAYKQLFRS